MAVVWVRCILMVYTPPPSYFSPNVSIFDRCLIPMHRRLFATLLGRSIVFVAVGSHKTLGDSAHTNVYSTHTTGDVTCVPQWRGGERTPSTDGLLANPVISGAALESTSRVSVASCCVFSPSLFLSRPVIVKSSRLEGVLVACSRLTCTCLTPICRSCVRACVCIPYLNNLFVPTSWPACPLFHRGGSGSVAPPRLSFLHVFRPLDDLRVYGCSSMLTGTDIGVVCLPKGQAYFQGCLNLLYSGEAGY